MSLPYVPQTITVHLGEPDSPAQNVTVDFIDYVKNVASSEIFPTWPESSLRANILAQISFALNRVYTEYYRSRGYPFDITSSTSVDQSFVNGRNVYDTVSRIVDEIFNDYLRRVGYVEPLFARYCNGTTVTCDGLSQWGTVELAEQGLDSVQILRRYYGNNVEVVVDAPVMGITSSVPVRALRPGSTGNDVLSVQLRLNRISRNFPSIPKIPRTDGYFDTSTEDAVLEFQRVFDLDVDGVVGPATWYRIQQIYSSVKRLNELDSEGITYSEIPRIYPEYLGPGASGNGVRATQYMLNFVAQYEDTVSPFPISGNYDAATEEAVRGFQRTYGIEPTGIVDENTYARLFDVYSAIILSLPDSLFTETARPYPGFRISRGFDGDYVSDLQRYLGAIATVFPTVIAPAVTGVYDEATENAVKEVQRLSSLEVTGVTDLLTWSAIGELYNDVRSGEITSPEQYPGYILGGDNNGI